MEHEKETIVIGVNDVVLPHNESTDVFHIIRAAVVAPVLLTMLCIIKGFLLGEASAVSYPLGVQVGFSGAEAAAANLIVFCIYTGFMPLWIQTGIGVLAGIVGPQCMRKYSRWVGTIILIAAFDIILGAILLANQSTSVPPIAAPVEAIHSVSER